MPDISEKRINEAINIIQSLDMDMLFKIANKHIEDDYQKDSQGLTDTQIRINLEDFLYEDYSWVNPFIDALKRNIKGRI